MTYIDTLKQAHDTLRADVGPKRRAAHKAEGKLAAAYLAAMDVWDDLKAKGVPMVDLVAGMEHVLRENWPKGDDEHAPRYVCRDCEDRGARYERRPARIYGGRLVDVVVPCRCGKGTRFMETRKDDSDFRAAARSKPMTKVGR